jgi:hypothetical protein
MNVVEPLASLLRTSIYRQNNTCACTRTTLSLSAIGGLSRLSRRSFEVVGRPRASTCKITRAGSKEELCDGVGHEGQLTRRSYNFRPSSPFDRQNEKKRRTRASMTRTARGNALRRGVTRVNASYRWSLKCFRGAIVSGVATAVIIPRFRVAAYLECIFKFHSAASVKKILCRAPSCKFHSQHRPAFAPRVGAKVRLCWGPR